MRDYKVITSVLLILLFCEVPGKIRRVPQEYHNIQAAVNACSVGDTVLVSEGKYYENILITKNIVLASLYLFDDDPAHIEKTIIDGSRPKSKSYASVIRINGPTDTLCQVTGFTVQGGSGDPQIYPDDILFKYWMSGGGINITDAGARISHNNVINNNVLEFGKYNCSGGAGISAGTARENLKSTPYVIIEYNRVTGNTAIGHWAEGGGIVLGQSGRISHNIIMYNRVNSRTRSAGGGAGIYLTSDYDIIFSDNYVRYNSAGIAGGLVIGSGKQRRGRAIILNNIFVNNRAFEVGGAVNLAEEGYGIFLNNTFADNKSITSAGAINITVGAHGVLHNNILWNNGESQLSVWGKLQASHNLVQGGARGFRNLDEDPLFIPGDTLYRLTDDSPCISAGTAKPFVRGLPLTIPDRDFRSFIRPMPAGTSPDIGAVESVKGDTEENSNEYGDNYIKLFILVKQVAPPEINPATKEIIGAGKMEIDYTLNNKHKYHLMRAGKIAEYTFSPGGNQLTLEASFLGRDSARKNNAYIWLEGVDQNVQVASKKYNLFYTQWSSLKPGKYLLNIQPQDDQAIIAKNTRISIGITVLPYWYQTWWAYLIYGVGVLMIAIVYTRIRVRNLKARQESALNKVQLEKYAEMDKLKSRFFANVTHELRTPLTLILGPIESVLGRKPDKESVEDLGIARRNGYRLLRLVDMLLQYARLEAGTMRLHAVNQDIVPVIRRTVSYFASPAAKKNLELDFTCPAGKITGDFDEEKIEHITQNIISNALKFTPGGGSIRVNAEENNGNLTLTVRDTGIGISKENQKRLFERFFRAERSHKTEGTGIGLSLSKEMAELHHGSLTVESALHKGTTVTVTIPLSGYSEEEKAPVEHKEPYPPAESISASAENGSVSTANGIDLPIVLIAEDNDDARRYIASVFRDNYSVLEAEDGQRALEQSRVHMPDIVISDVMMPDMDGFELCQSLKNEEKTSHIPVILLTALADRKDKIDGLHLGADDYLTKPFDKQELLTRVQNLLELRKRLRESYSHSIKLQPGEIQAASLDDKFVKRAKQVAEAHIPDMNFSVEQFAHEMFLSRVQFYRKLKAVTNFSPLDFLRIIRLERARELLEKNFGTIAEVAEATGFTNQSYFAKSFHSHFGINPHDVRKNP